MTSIEEIRSRISADPELLKSLENFSRQLKAEIRATYRAAISAEIDEDQKDFIESEAEVIRLLAPAGAGKTSTIINRVLTQAANGKSPGEVLILTFDNSAQNSLMNRLDSLVGAKQIPDKPVIATLNSFGNRFLLNYYHDLNRHFTLLTPREASPLMLSILRNIKAQAPNIAQLFPRQTLHIVMLKLVSRLKNEIVYWKELREKEAIRVLAQDSFVHKVIQSSNTSLEQEVNIYSFLIAVFLEYCETMERQLQIDFDDQKLITYILFRDDPALCQQYMARFREVIVDEFQDINYLDFMLIELISRERQLIVVGDDDQAIYTFRGSNPNYLINLEEHLNRTVTTKILRYNYRCPANLVIHADRLIQNNKARISKQIIPAREEHAAINILIASDAIREASQVADLIKLLKHDHPQIRYRDFAILIRMNAQSIPVQLAFIHEQIPYHTRLDDNIIRSTVFKNILEFFELRVLILNETLNVSRQFSRLLIKTYFKYADNNMVDKFHACAGRKGDYLAAAADYAEWLDERFAKEAQFFYATVYRLYESSTPYELMALLVNHFHGLQVQSVGKTEDTETIDPAAQFLHMAKSSVQTIQDFYEMLREVSLRSNMGRLSPSTESGDSVNILTYFKAKGQQWPYVFIIGANQGTTPHPMADMETERRLFYVALTRALKSLTISYIARTQKTDQEPSQFIREAGLHE